MRHTFLLLGCIFFVACGGSSSDLSTGDDSGSGDDALSDGTSSDGSNDTTTDDVSNDGVPNDGADTSSSGDAGSDGDGAPPVCSSEPTRVACQDCCAAEHKDGAKVFEAALLACACTDGVCKTECATTACASPATKADDKCRVCLQSSLASTGDAGADAASPEGKCRASVTSACSTDSKCVAYETCLGTCP